jgi:hypothetical protein
MGFNLPNLRAAAEVFGRDRMLFGSDYGPAPISPNEHIELVDQLTTDAMRSVNRQRVVRFATRHGRNARA